MSTLNTGLITIQNYGQILPPHLVALTVAHELGHSLGSPHDEGVNCGDLGSNEGKGRYLMFPHATDEVRENSDKFSPCSIERISSILKQKKDDCFEDNPETCVSSTSPMLSAYFQNKSLPLVGGAPCSQNQGYCDKFHVCRLLDADGPIARLKNSFLHLDDFDDMAEWMKAHWWAILLVILTLSAVMGCTVCLCSRTLNTRDLE